VPRHVAVRDYGSTSFAWSLLVELTQVTWMATTNARPLTPASRVVAGLVRELAPGLAVGEGAPARGRSG
jgi:hypothetical protein